jgi:hypothetical protein
MAKSIRWLRADVREVSGVDAGANRKDWLFFKRSDRKREGDDMDRGTGQINKQESQVEPIIEEGIALYPWNQGVEDMSAAFSIDDAPRVLGLLLAKFGEGPDATIKLPAGVDPVEAARAAIEEGKSLMAANPLLRPEGNARATTATKSAVKAALIEGLKELGLHKLVKPKTVKKAAAEDEGGGVAVAESDLLAEIKTLNGHLASLASAPKPVRAKEEDEDDEDVVGVGRDKDTDEEVDQDEEEEDEASEEGTDVEKAVMAHLHDISNKLESFSDRLAKVEKRMAKSARGMSRAQHDEDDDAHDGAPRKGKYFSTLAGSYFDREKVEPYIVKHAGGKK